MLRPVSRDVMLAALVAVAMLGSLPVHAQTQAQQDRLNQVGRYVVTAPMCQRLGMRLDPDLPSKVEAAMTSETSGWAIDPAVLSRLKSEALASWQTPRIQARGDLMMLAGSCRSRIGAARSDAIVAEFGRSDDPRVRAYYVRSFDEGLADPTAISTLAGCNRAIAAYRLKAR